MGVNFFVVNQVQTGEITLLLRIPCIDTYEIVKMQRNVPCLCQSKLLHSALFGKKTKEEVVNF